MNKSLLPLLACSALALPATADEAAPPAAPAAPAPVAAPEAAAPAAPGPDMAALLAIDPASPPVPSEGRSSSRKDEYRARLQALSDERAAHAKAAREAGEAIEARRAALAAENEEVGALVAEVADLESRLEAARTKLQGFYDADETISGLVARRADEQAATIEAHRTLQTAIAAAMRGRAEEAAALEARLAQESAEKDSPSESAPEEN